MGDSARGRGSRLVITVHGIRTFGHWQERLEQEIHEVDPHIQVIHYKYGYLSLVGFFIPPLRWLITRAFRRALHKEAARIRPESIAIVAHSFGTHLAGWALRGDRGGLLPHIDLLILAGSVLRSTFPWNDLMPSRVSCVVNECGTRDVILVLNQVFVPLTGMAGWLGFVGLTGPRFRNRFHAFGHSGYFADESGQKGFMTRHWVPLLVAPNLADSGVEPIDERTPTPLTGLYVWALSHLEPIKLTIYLMPVVFFALWLNGQRVQLKAALASQVVLTDQLVASETKAKDEAERAERLATVAQEQQRIAEDRADEISTSSLVLQSKLDASSPLTALSLALEASSRRHSPATAGQLVEAFIAGKPLSVLPSSAGRVVLLQWFDTGDLIAARDSGNVDVWRMAGSQPKLSRRKGPPIVNGCSERNQVLTLHAHGRLALLDQRGTVVHEWDGQADPKKGCFIAFTSSLVFTFRADNRMLAWDREGRLVGEAQLPGNPIATENGFGTYQVVVATDDGSLTAWNVQSGQTHTVSIPSGPANSLSMGSGDDGLLVTAQDMLLVLDRNLAVTRRVQTPRVQLKAVWSLGEVVAIDIDGDVRTFDARNVAIQTIPNQDRQTTLLGQLLRSFSGSAEGAKELKQFDVVAGPKFLLSLSGGLTAWQLTDGTAPEQVARLGMGVKAIRMARVRWSDVAIAQSDGRVSVWHPEVRGMQDSVAHNGRPYAVSWSSNGDYFASVSGTRNFSVWDRSGRYRFGGSMDDIVDVVWRPGGSSFAVISSGCGVELFESFDDGSRPGPARREPPRFDSSPCRATWSPDGESLALSPFLGSVLVIMSLRQGGSSVVWVDADRYAATGATVWFPDSSRLVAIGTGESAIVTSDGHVDSWLPPAKGRGGLSVPGSDRYRLVVAQHGWDRNAFLVKDDPVFRSVGGPGCASFWLNVAPARVACVNGSSVRLFGGGVSHTYRGDSDVKSVSWGSDGKRIVIDTASGFSIVESGGQLEYTVPHRPGGNAWASWRPDGQQLAFTFESSASTELWPASIAELRRIAAERLEASRASTALGR